MQSVIVFRLKFDHSRSGVYLYISMEARNRYESRRSVIGRRVLDLKFSPTKLVCVCIKMRFGKILNGARARSFNRADVMYYFLFETDQTERRRRPRRPKIIKI